MIKYLILFLFLSSSIFAQNVKYRYLPPKPNNPSMLNNTINSQLANQNINFNSGALFSPQISGTLQFTQINNPANRINNLYGFSNQPNFISQNNFSQSYTGFLKGTTTPSGYNPFNNPYYQMATNMIGGYNNYKYFGFNGGKGL